MFQTSGQEFYTWSVPQRLRRLFTSNSLICMDSQSTRNAPLAHAHTAMLSFKIWCLWPGQHPKHHVLAPYQKQMILLTSGARRLFRIAHAGINHVHWPFRQTDNSTEPACVNKTLHKLITFFMTFSIGHYFDCLIWPDRFCWRNLSLAGKHCIMFRQVRLDAWMRWAFLLSRAKIKVKLTKQISSKHKLMKCGCEKKTNQPAKMLVSLKFEHTV